MYENDARYYIEKIKRENENWAISFGQLRELPSYLEKAGFKEPAKEYRKLVKKLIVLASKDITKNP